MKARPDATKTEFSDLELDVFGDFTDAVKDGKNPDMDEYLRRCPGSEARLRPIFETALLLDRVITQHARAQRGVQPEKASV